jgi:hypothetical protein
MKPLVLILSACIITYGTSEARSFSLNIMNIPYQEFTMNIGDNADFGVADEEAFHSQPLDSLCAPPSGHPYNMSFTSTRDSVKGNFVDTSGADGYLAVFSVNIRLDFVPVDGVSYPAKSQVGNATVLKYGSGTTLSTGGLTPGTYYYITIFPYHSTSCVGGPRYNSSRPTVATFTTKP